MSSGSEVSEPGSPDARGLNKNVKVRGGGRVRAPGRLLALARPPRLLPPLVPPFPGPLDAPRIIHAASPSQLSLWFNLLETASSSVRAGDALSAYVFLVTKSNAAVGYVQGFNGIAQV